MKNRRNLSTALKAGCVLVLMLFVITGCNYLNIPAVDDILARPDNKKDSSGGPVFNSAVIKGRIIREDPNQAHTMIAAYRFEKGKAEFKGYSVLRADSPFMIYLPEGRYHLYALTDYNHNGVFENDEISGVCGSLSAPADIDVHEGQLISGITIQTSKENCKLLKLPAPWPEEEKQNFIKQVTYNGQILKIYSEYFSPENAQTGYWHPSSFMKAFGAHIYLTGEYHPRKIPVLFVHGTEGSPHNWIYLWMRMDHTRYQPLFFYYPSGIRLSLAAALLDEELKDLHAKYNFKKMVVVAHSVGGLTCRAFMNRYVSDRQNAFIKLFITFATPWSGFGMADASQQLPHKSIPAWTELGTQSDFIQNTMNEKLPRQVSHYIFYGKNDKLSADKAVDERAVTCAAASFGFDCTHDSILSDRNVYARFNSVLEKEMK